MRVRARKSGIWRASLLTILVTILPMVSVGHAESGTAVLTGAVLDPSGQNIPGVTLTLVDSLTGASRTTVSGNAGLYRFSDLSAGTYHLKASYQNFAPYSQDVTLANNEVSKYDVTLQLPAVKESVTVTTQLPNIYVPLAETRRDVGDSDRTRSHNTAELLGNLPGVNLRQNGTLATAPQLHGMGDERAKLLVNGVTACAACCPNHMNPALSYIDPSNVARLNVMAGITPVSMGGDSIGGTISVDSPLPVFARPGERLHTEGVLSSFYQSNGENYGPSLSAWIASRNVSFGYSGSFATNGDYTDGSGHLVTSSYSQSTENNVTLAAQSTNNLVVLQAGLHHTPYEGFASQQMDLVGDRAESLNLLYRRDLHWGVLETRVYGQNVRHEMNIGHDKSTFPMPMWMPMNTHGKDLGYSVKLGISLSGRHTLVVGNEFQRYFLDDDWPAVPMMDPYMGPNTFVSINSGHRERLAWYAEVASKWNSKWTTLFGIRNDTVWTNTGPVSGYSDLYATDADAFNALDRAQTDVNFDATALTRYEPNSFSTIEFGYARKTRAPNLYERYAWSTNMMASGMINWFGDGNYYVGNVGLRPEIANTVSGTVSWHDRKHKEWEIKLTPYQTYIQNYIDVDTLMTTMYGASTFAQLRFANHNARIYGADFSGHGALWDSPKFGRGEIGGVAGYLHGERLDTGTALYQMMPLNARIGFDETFKRWTTGFELQLVDRKSDVDPHRYEQKTPGYALLNLHSGYKWKRLRMDIGGDNLLNKSYALPLGGVNFDDYMASGWSSQILPLTGPGRSFYTSLTVQY